MRRRLFEKLAGGCSCRLRRSIEVKEGLQQLSPSQLFTFSNNYTYITGEKVIAGSKSGREHRNILWWEKIGP